MPKSLSVDGLDTEISVSTWSTLTRFPPFLTNTPSSRIRCVTSPTLRTALSLQIHRLAAAGPLKPRSVPACDGLVVAKLQMVGSIRPFRESRGDPR